MNKHPYINGLLERAVSQSKRPTIIVTHDLIVVYVNDSFCRTAQYPHNELIYHNLSDIPSFSGVYERLVKKLEYNPKNSWQEKISKLGACGRPYSAILTISKVHDNDGKLTHYIGEIQRIENTSPITQDPLTGLINRDAFIEKLKDRQVPPTPAPLSLLLISIDNFNRIKGSFGHSVGDLLLAKVAMLLSDFFASTTNTLICRFAGREFSILLENLNEIDAKAIANEILGLLREPLHAGHQLIQLTASIGIASAEGYSTSPQQLIQHAELALHQAKLNGRSQLQSFKDSFQKKAKKIHFIETNLPLALKRNQLTLHYQPKIWLHNGQMQGVEALLRWTHPTIGSIAPADFIPVAEETGLIINIGKWVIREACRQARVIKLSMDVDLKIAVNLSPRQFCDHELVSSITDILHSEKVPAALLELELTESALIGYDGNTLLQLEKLKESGVRLAIDDFGTGYSSLSHIKNLPIDTIKIDRSFIQDIYISDQDKGIVTAIINMAHSLKMKVIAEGVENNMQARLLRENGCDIAQGYLYSPPLSSDGLISLLDSPHKETIFSGN
ncbi:EAL domain-containing protein [Pseudomonas chlororaphis]|uniref:EAL domain-containing protein n=1 Tax=Pseudomonas chlororaphis TaxID=587753 RepID=UPI0023656A79|nr:EAL domain-containing protein [Pseudomonas chlororaphis]WDH19998.1 EAL domain-containing protein [Pseudomonas chlororaphis]